MTVVYEGTAEGFLSLVFEVYAHKLSPTHILKTHPQSLLEVHEVRSDQARARRVMEGMKRTFSPLHVREIQQVLLCDTLAFELPLLETIKLGFKNPKHLDDLTLEPVHKVQKWAKAYSRALHCMKGFVRFEEVEEGVLYAKIQTDYNLIAPLGWHFVERLGAEKFILHDVKRGLAFVSEHKEVYAVAHVEAPKVSENELTCKRLWQTFFNHIAIQNRTNPKLQQAFVPLKYRTYMSEFEPSSAALHVSTKTHVRKDAALVHKGQGL